MIVAGRGTGQPGARMRQELVQHVAAIAVAPEKPYKQLREPGHVLAVGGTVVFHVSGQAPPGLVVRTETTDPRPLVAVVPRIHGLHRRPGVQTNFPLAAPVNHLALHRGSRRLLGVGPKLRHFVSHATPRDLRKDAELAKLLLGETQCLLVLLELRPAFAPGCVALSRQAELARWHALLVHDRHLAQGIGQAPDHRQHGGRFSQVGRNIRVAALVNPRRHGRCQGPRAAIHAPEDRLRLVGRFRRIPVVGVVAQFDRRQPDRPPSPRAEPARRRRTPRVPVRNCVTHRPCWKEISVPGRSGNRNCWTQTRRSKYDSAEEPA